MIDATELIDRIFENLEVYSIQSLDGKLDDGLQYSCKLLKFGDNAYNLARGRVVAETDTTASCPHGNLIAIPSNSNKFDISKNSLLDGGCNGDLRIERSSIYELAMYEKIKKINRLTDYRFEVGKTAQFGRMYKFSEKFPFVLANIIKEVLLEHK